ncbi:MAG: glycoside hydrolase family 2 TIM barrel-domain containing protein [Bacteroidota bacterium]|nr:glycoside hydrolase family 2 TIM barrel-domain containing protein [Bacteroidota bacterium]
MRKYIQYIPLFILILMVSLGCQNMDDGSDGPRKVLIEQSNGKYTLTVDGEAFFVKGAGCEFGNIEALAQHGANSFRTWRTDNDRQTGQEVLDKAQENGLLVCMGIEIARERHGFDYNDAKAVQKQFEFAKAEVLKYKDHPALLAWGIGNELNLRATNPKVWDAVNDIAEMIHQEDPNHPSTTMLSGFSKELGTQIAERAPAVDFLSVQFYADIVNLPKYLEEARYDKPYLITEWGATGHWESPTTTWGRPIEQNSKDKADSYKMRYETVIAADSQYCLGSYVFLWGQKQERTPTWYGMFLENGDETASVDAMHYVWNGEWPENQTPTLKSFTMNGLVAGDNVTITSMARCKAEANVSDPDQDEMTFHWEIIPEVPEGEQSDGGDLEARQRTVKTVFENQGTQGVSFVGPENPGEYRLFVYVSDGQGHSATANIPFLVK